MSRSTKAVTEAGVLRFPDRVFAFDEFGPLGIRPPPDRAGLRPVTPSGIPRPTTTRTGAVLIVTRLRPAGTAPNELGLAFDCLVDLGDDLELPLPFWQHLDGAAREMRLYSDALHKPHLTAADLGRRLILGPGPAPGPGGIHNSVPNSPIWQLPMSDSRHGGP
ncbi:hypothetical protein [Streptomyces sp. NPDC002403]